MSSESTVRAKVASLTTPFVWSDFYLDKNGRWCLNDSGNSKGTARELCQVHHKSTPRLMARFDRDPEAIYFDASHPDGIPVDWEDAPVEPIWAAAWDLSTWAASIGWDPEETNSAEWLAGLKERIERVQALCKPLGFGGMVVAPAVFGRLLKQVKETLA